MDRNKMLLGIIVFGSLWGVSECVLAPLLSDAGFPSGPVMAGVFATGLMILSRSWYRQPGMQIGMGMVAGFLRLFNPFGSCIICSAIAIAAEGVLFELLWYTLIKDAKRIRTPLLMASTGVISAYGIFIGGYIITQVLTPVVSSSGFYLENLLMFLPQILARGTLAAIFGVITVPIALSLRTPDISSIKNRVYYPTTLAVSAVCWLVVIGNLLIASA